MNVANLVSPMPAAVQPQTGQAGAALPNGPAAGLFALQLQDFLAYNGETAALPAAHAEEGGAQEVPWDEILALLEQWFPGTIVSADGTAAAESADPTEGLAVAARIETVSNGAAQDSSLAAMFMKAGLPSPQAQELARILAAVMANGDASQEAQNADLAPQLKQLLEPLMAEAVRDRAGQEAPVESLPADRERTPLPLNARMAAYAPVMPVEAQGGWNTLHVNRALTAYQAEAVTTVKTAVRLQESSESLNVANASTEAAHTEMFEAEEGQAFAAFTRLTAERSEPVGPQVPIREMVRADRFVEDVQALFVRQLKIGAAANGTTQARLILYPQSLGQVEVTISAENGVITAQFTAETAAGRELLDNQMFQLRHALAQQGIQVDKLVVTQQPQQEQTYGFQEQRENPQQHAQQEQPRQQQSHGQQPEFAFDELVEGWGDSDAEAAGWLSGALNTSA